MLISSTLFALALLRKIGSKPLTHSESIALSIPLGIVFSSWLAYFLGPDAISEILIFSSLAFLLRPKKLSWKSDSSLLTLQVPVVLTFGALLWNHLVFKEGEGGTRIYTMKNCYGDLPFHFAIINSFLHGCNSDFPLVPEFPLFSDEPLRYSFLFDFHTSLMIRYGASIKMAMFVPSVMLAYSFSTLLHHFLARIFLDVGVALIGQLFLLLSGGFGWVRFLMNIKSPMFDSKDYVLQIPDENDYFWFPFIDATLIPQRTALIGYPIVLAILTLVISVFRSKTQHYRIALGAGVLMGLLPLVHMHSFLAVGIIAVTYALMSPRKFFVWAAFGASSLLLAGPQLWIILGRIRDNTSFISFDPVWTGETPFYLLKSFGLLGILIVLGLFISKRRIIQLSIPFFLLAVISVLVRFQPWKFDNIKLTNVALFFLVALAAYVILWLVDKHLLFLAIILFALTIFSGTLSLMAIGHRNYQLYNVETVEAAEFIQKYTDPKSTFYSTDYNVHNDAAASLSGRRIMIGNPGWLWTHGININNRQGDHHRMSGASSDDAIIYLYRRYSIDYIIQSNSRPVSPRIVRILDLGRPVFQNSQFVIYELRHENSN